MTEPLVSPCKIFYGSTDESNFFAKGKHCYATSPPPTLVRLTIKAKNYVMYLLFYLNSVQAMVTSVMKKVKSNDVGHYDMCIKL